MKLEDVKEIYQTTDWSIDVNSRLKSKEWEILRIFNSKSKGGDVEVIMPMYVLGKR